MNITTLLFIYTVVIYAVGVVIGRMSKRLDYENKKQE